MEVMEVPRSSKIYSVAVLAVTSAHADSSSQTYDFRRGEESATEPCPNFCRVLDTQHV